jgi:hypothetical protein
MAQAHREEGEKCILTNKTYSRVDTGEADMDTRKSKNQKRIIG